MSTAVVTSARPGAVLADLLPAATAARARVRDAALVLGGAALTGVAAQFSVPVPGSPVPVSGQTFAVLLVGAAYGPVRAALSLLLYAAAGMAGMPWFAEGASGWSMPTLGYIIGFVVAAAVTGGLARRGGDRTVLRTAGTMAVGSLIIYAFGVPYLALDTGMSLTAAADAGMVPFLFGDALKAALAMGLLPVAWRLAGRGGPGGAGRPGKD
ncbi:biotin transporter BioY [Streptomyces aidingensis]|uniref:Biotin transporter n=1 Tax=Streptomyces aidingensis TaxID=910347 RepID=A0A1I1FDU1_9ACTN|nr:biotin transporter BioY [Streptomyces aidingensis]SFB97535.1 biotin transport system substrate-specific component [Streptomyces aidingensis]